VLKHANFNVIQISKGNVYLNITGGASNSSARTVTMKTKHEKRILCSHISINIKSTS